MNGRERSGVGPSEVRAAEVRCVSAFCQMLRSVCLTALTQKMTRMYGTYLLWSSLHG